MIQLVFYERTDLDHIKNFPFEYRVKQYSWNVYGGPEEMTAVVDFTGYNDALLWSMISYLRCGVTVIDPIGRPVWWGYIHTINLNNGYRTYGVSMDTMFNRVKATYELIGAGSTSNDRADTVWQQSDASIAEFGAKEKVYPLVAISTDVANADVTARLSKSQFPTSISDLQARNDSIKSVEFICKGWWYTLNWLYYENANTGYVALEELLDDMLDAGEFVTDIYSKMSSSFLTTEYHLGDYMIRDEVEQLMDVGTDNNRRILSTMTPDRYVLLTEEPNALAVSTENYYLDRYNNLYDPYGGRVDPTVCKVGVWAILKDFDGFPHNTRTMIPPSPIFIERAIYNVETGVYQPEQRGYKSPFEEIQGINR